MLICPKCHFNLKKINNTYKCENNHSFDISKDKYVNLLLSHPNAGDNKEMVEARKSFLENGFYDNLALAIAPHLDNQKLIIDCGCGTGYYLYKLNTLTNSKMFIGLDISKIAIEKAAKMNKQFDNFTFIVSSVNNIPLSSNTCDAILNIFAPYSNNEFSRVLKKDGFLYTVRANANHLIELKEILYENPYLNDEKEYNLPDFELISEDNIQYTVQLKNLDILNLMKMTPYYYKTSKDSQKKLDDLPSLLTTISFKLSKYKKRNSL